MSPRFSPLLRLLCLALLLLPTVRAAAQFNAAPGGQQAFGLPGGQQGNPQQGGGALGGGVDADFDSLIDLIVSTVAPESWADAGGEAEVRAYANGVLVDAGGTLRRASSQGADQLAALRRETRPADAMAPGRQAASPRRGSSLRCVSLSRLEQEISRRQQGGEPLDEAMLTLAGLRRAEFVLLFPPRSDRPGDLVIAGPAGDWRAAGGRLLAVDGGRPVGAVVRLDDLIELLRHMAAGGGAFGCTIDPRPGALAEAQQFISQAAAEPLRPGARARERWLETIRARVGEQDIRFFDIDPTSRVARVLIEADHHMKLIGMGLADGVAALESYLDSVEARPGEAPPAVGVLRWWFSMNYTAVRRTDDGDAFRLVGPGARVMSENQLLTERGERVPTGASDEPTARFADGFTANFAALSVKHPVYSELRNVFDLALIATLIRDERLAERAGWEPTLFLDSGLLPLPKHRPPKSVETVANHRVIGRRHVVAGVSGGVDANPADVLRRRVRPAGEEYGPLAGPDKLRPAGRPAASWWWDAR